MGREVRTICHWQGRSGEALVLLESQELLVRGEVKLRLARAEIEAFSVTATGLVVTAPGGTLTVELSPELAARWAQALAKAPPTLASKLGLEGRRALVVGRVEDSTLAEALQGHTTATSPDLLLAVILDSDDLNRGLHVAGEHPTLPLWCVYRKGPQADPGDAAIRDVLRGAGYIDTKACAVSATLTATRYHPASIH